MLTTTLDELISGTLRWLSGNLHFFPGNTQATFELAILCRCWARSRPADARLDEASCLLREVWRQPGFAKQIRADPHHAHLFEVSYLALAPGVALQRAGIPRTRPRHEDPKLSARDAAYLRLEAHYYSELAGLPQPAAPYAELYKPTLLGNLRDVSAVSGDRAYLVAHIAFYLSDFGGRRPALSQSDLDQAAAIVAGLLERCVERGDNWDLASELVIAQLCLGGDPLRTASGQVAIRRLTAEQLSDGSLPSRPSARPQAPLPAAESFRMRYHSTLAATLMAVLVLSGPAVR